MKTIKSSKTSSKNIAFGLVILVLSLISATFLGGGIYGSNTSTASALTYSNTTDLSFTFNPTLSISLSSNTININNLVPGQAADSDPITVSVSSNTPYGYSLFASVGNSTDYDTTSLTHADSSTGNNAVFTSIATNANIADLTNFQDNTWGYSYKSTAEGSTWSTYNGLPLYSTVDDNTSTENPAKLIDTKDPVDNKSINFKLAAKASSTQASGAYNNVINFYAVGKPYVPPSISNYTYMQDFAALSESDKQDLLVATPTEQVYTLKDKRDEQEYTVAKLKDGKIWMTKNLNLAGGTVITSELSNVPDNYTLPTANGFQSGNKLPASSTSGFNDNTKAYVYNSTKTTGTDCSKPGCYSYYSWTAATAGSGISIAADNTDAPYSICPKGWKLPNSRSTVAGNSDFYQLAIAYGMAEGSTSQSTSNFYDQAGPGTTPNFLLTGRYSNGSFNNGGGSGIYWSSTSSSRTDVWHLLFSPSYVYSAISLGRGLGYAVRCIAE